MNSAVAIFPTPFAAWSRRVALFSLQLVILGIILHRFLSLSTPVALNLFATAMAGAVLAILLGLIAGMVIWRLGRSGAWSAAAGTLLGLAMLAWPAFYLPLYRTLPQINDITTDYAQPPRFQAIAQIRPKGSNDPNHLGPALAKIQAEHYPDIKPIIIPRPPQETFEMIGDIVRRLRWKVEAETPPQGKGRPAVIEAVERTLVLGFYDDIAIRIDGDQRESRIDVRSASRYGQHDFGRNAQRVRRLFTEIKTQLESGIGTDRLRRKRRGPEAAVPKRTKGAPQAAAAQSKSKGAARSGAQREQQQKGKQPARAESRGRDRQ